ncbi:MULTISPECIES: topoisomerase C-terminal repeat-containing protein [Erysipelotrichaceae]|uniref:topoisomerase C-terminal repeat-containing protein n=2 Tax=Erysipelotrichales TaxID=526525 RepID=UPI0025B78639|nr:MULTISPECIES: hypothetical protein [Erysipelotrichaceae]
MKNDSKLGVCPLCGNDVINSMYSWYCVENGRSCDFKLPHSIPHGFGDKRKLIRLEEEEARALIEGGSIVRELVSKTGTPYKARLKLSIREDAAGHHWSNLKWDSFAD